MSIKLIAVDMDGTFLSDAKTYNRPRFLAQYQRMREQNIRFVVASGNQYYQLISFFPEIAHQIAFVAENGGWVVSGNEDVFNCRTAGSPLRRRGRPSAGRCRISKSSPAGSAAPTPSIATTTR